jgi:hypothetical protein
LTLFFLAGCAGTGPRPESPKPARKDPAARSLVDQYKAARGAFQDKLAAAPGLSLAELRARWGQVRQGITQNKSTIYHWVETLSVIPPPEAAAELGLNPPGPDQSLTLSCMAVFIVNQRGMVEEAFSEGRCLDHTLMPGWKPTLRSAGRDSGRSG